MVYDETDLSYMLHDEGMVRIGHSGEARSYTYFYHLKDHLGNTRVEFQANPDNSCQVTQRQSYYPFGLRFEVAPAGENEYLYNGKQIQQDLIAGRSLGWYDYGARMYDAALGRFHTLDPLADINHFQSPFVYADNNPILLIDFMGMDSDTTNTSSSSSSSSNSSTQQSVSQPQHGEVDENGNVYHKYGGWVTQEQYDNWEKLTITNNIDAPEFSGSFWDWANKINHLGQRKWTDPNTGIAYIIDDDGNVLGYAPITGTAPIPGSGGANLVKLTGKGAKILGNLKNLKNIRLADAIKLRGGTGSNINKVASWLRGKSVAEVANEAAKGNAEAKTALKILKQAKRLSQKR